jgi:hypothetical protein
MSSRGRFTCSVEMGESSRAAGACERRGPDDAGGALLRWDRGASDGLALALGGRDGCVADGASVKPTASRPSWEARGDGGSDRPHAASSNGT